VKKPKICLFTAHAPTGGGGGAILRSLVAELAGEYEISWRYVSAQAATGYESGWLGPPLMGRGNFVADVVGTAALLAGHKPKAWECLLENLCSLECDAYWIVSHNEGLCVARDLRGRTSRPVHLTVHDDWAGALCARSTRYRFLAPIADAATRRVLSRANSVDVVSRGMREFYRGRTGVEALICHRYLSHLPSPVPSPDGLLTVGHIGSIYSAQELMVFADAFKRFCDERGEKGRIRLWGCHLRSRDVPRQLQEWIEFNPNQEEEQVVLELQQCHFVYAMYPLTPRLRRFSQTSLPTKLSTYVLAQRPILGYGPARSSLASFLEDTQAGVMWSSADVQDGVRSINSLMQHSVKRKQWENARELYYGEANIRVMLQVLEKIAANAVKSSA
jgi:hypothetical protein